MHRRHVRAARAHPRGHRRRARDVTPELVALTDSTTRGCQVVLAGLGLGADDEVVTTDQEHFGLLGPLHASGARVVVDGGGREGVARGGDAADAADRRLARPLDDRTQARSRTAAASDGPPLLVDGAQSAGAIPVDFGDARLLHRSAQKWLCGPDPSGALFVARSGTAARGAAERVLAGAVRDRRLVRAEGRRAAVRLRLDRRAGARAGSKRRSGCIPTGGTRLRPRRPPAAASCSSRTWTS